MSQTGEIHHWNAIGFADDMNFLAVSITEEQSIDTICHNLNTIRQTASDCIRASGGSFGLPKCSWWCSAPINNNKIWDEYPSPFPLQLASTATVQPITIHQMRERQPHCQLGVHLVPSLSPKCQIQLLVNQSKELKVTLRRNSITAHVEILRYMGLTVYLGRYIVYCLLRLLHEGFWHHDPTCGTRWFDQQWLSWFSNTKQSRFTRTIRDPDLRGNEG